MKYEPQTTGPIEPKILQQAAQLVAEKNYLGDNLIHDIYVDQSDNWGAVGVEVFLKGCVVDRPSMEAAMYLDEQINPEFINEMSTHYYTQFHNALTRLVNDSSLTAPYNTVIEQIETESTNFSESIEYNDDEIMDHAWKGIEEFVKKVGLSVEEFAKFTKILMPNSVPQDYLVFRNAKAFVDYIVDEELDEEDLFNYMNDGKFDEDYYEEHGLDAKALEFLYSQTMTDMYDWANKTLTVELRNGIMISYIG